MVVRKVSKVMATAIDFHLRGPHSRFRERARRLDFALLSPTYPQHLG
jgi:hypothetical protein